MRRTAALLLPIAILAVALSLSGHPHGSVYSKAQQGAEETAVSDTADKRSSDGKETADTVPDTPEDSTVTDGGQRESATPSSDFVNGVITPPEQPEASAFAPTMMDGIEAASPMAGISIITPPAANNRGTASLQYPFIMPPARNGMQPSLGIAYDSDAGDGICGEGWTMPISSITVDTRWGVPRYSTEKETETYLLDGQMLAMQTGSSLYLAHRNPIVSRNSSGTRRFHPRTGTDFSLVERVNVSPSTYYWKVTAPDGTVYTYGLGNAMLKGSFTDVSGNTREVIAEWLLSRIEEPHGDYVRYAYHTVATPSVGGLSARFVRLDTIMAGHRDPIHNQDAPPHTVVRLHYTDRDATDMRQCSARYGFLTSSGHLLDSVAVFFKDSLLRSYKLQYAGGRFGKKLLTSVTHRDNKGNTAAFQTFEYYDDAASNNTLTLFPSETVPIPAESTGIKAEFPKNIADGNGFYRHPTSLGGSTGSSIGSSVYAGIGTGATNDKANTAGVTVGFSQSTMKGAVTLADLNGDGLPDQVYRKDGVTFCRPLTVGTAGLAFGEAIAIASSPDFSRTVTTSFNGGAKGHKGIGKTGIVEISLPVDLMSSTSKTTSYMADVNGDGLTDIVNGGKVHFGYVDGNGIPAFSQHSSATPCPLVDTVTVAVSEESLLTAERDSLIRQSPMQDIVRIWRAPFSGTVDVGGTARLLTPVSPLGDDGEPVQPDGVYLSIQKDGTQRWGTALTNTTSIQTSCSGISVTEGDTIFFRVQCGRDSASNGWHDKVLWKQTIRYQGLACPTLPNGEHQNIYHSLDADFVSSDQPIEVGGQSFKV